LGAGVADRETNKELVAVAGPRGKPQMQQTSRRSWTKEKEQQFLAVLGETCNVTRACEAVGMSGPGAYKRRRKNAAFRAAWIETVANAYQRLELVLLDRTFNGTEKVIQRHDGTEDRMREYPNRIGLSLLKMHRDAVAEAETEAPAEDVDEVRERVINKLLRLKKRHEQE
jgi:predicted AAA+ superfamily ATPase